MASTVVSDENDSEDEFIPKRRSVKNTIASDDENSDIAPIHTEDITLCLSDDGENEENDDVNNPFTPRDNDCQRSISVDLTENLNLNNPSGDIPKELSSGNKPSSGPTAKKVSRVPFQTLFDSDSEPEDISRHNVQDTSPKGNNFSEEFQYAKPAKKKITNKKSKPSEQKRHSMWDSDSEDEPVKNTHKSSSKLSALYDSDSDDRDDSGQPKQNLVLQGVKNKGNSKKSAVGKQKKVISKDAMLTIRSESQRMTRESALSLPYHRPKQHCLADFLNRPRLAPTSMKASVEELVKFQKESEKQMKEFYQSESEHSDDDKDDDPDWNEDQEKEQNGNDKTENKSDAETENVIEIGKEIESRKYDKDKEMENKDDVDKKMENRDDFNRELENNDDIHKEMENKKDRKNNEDVEMENQEVEQREVQNEIKEDGTKIAKEKNVEKKQNSVVVELAKEEDGEKPENAKVAQIDKKRQHDDKEDIQKVDDDVEKETAERKDTDSFPIDSQNMRLKYSEELSEAIAPRRMNIDLMTDSEDEDVQMETVPSKPKEEPKLILRGNPNDVIDLDDDFTTLRSKNEDLESLKNRFMRHSLTLKSKASPTTLSVKVVDLASDGSIKGINEETVTWSSEKAHVDHTPPGLKMKMLKKKLQLQIIEQREKEFMDKEASKEQTEKEGFEDGEELLDDKEDDEAEDESDGGGDDDDEVEDDDDCEESLELSRKKKNNMFVDEEASVDDDVDEKSVDLHDNDEEDEEDEDSMHAKNSHFSRTDSTADMFASQVSDEDDEIPGYQRCRGRSDATPVSQLRKSITPSVPSTNESFRLPEISQISPTSSFQRNFRFDSDFNTEDADMSTTQVLKKYNEERQDSIMRLAESPEAPETEADLMAMCSGQFTTQRIPLDSQADNPHAIADSQDSQDLQLKWTEDSSNDESKSAKKIGATRLVIESSDDEGEDEAEALFKRKTKRLSFSDDEESNSVGADDFINDEEEEEEEEELPDPAEVMYDSDENEIPIKDAAAFLENEAELSEDEYVGSGDEDEGVDNDQMEEELGDLDDIDQDKVREELGRIHMRNMLDDDRRDVRFMQEMLLEDGELHEDGKGRQRQFRWKNAESATLMPSQTAGSDEEVVEEDEEDDGGWRRNRYEREMFLAGNLKDKDGTTVEIEVEEQQEDSELMILGKTILKRQNTTRIEVKETVSKPQQQISIPDSPMKSLLSRTQARGSFLSRTSDVLTRLARNASGKNGLVEKKPNNSRNFVFAAISPPKQQENMSDVENELRPNAKRKAKRSLIVQPEKKTCTSQPAEYTGLFNYL